MTATDFGHCMTELVGTSLGQGKIGTTLVRTKPFWHIWNAWSLDFNWWINMKCSLVPVSISDIWDSSFCAPPNLGACWVVPSVAACWFISRYLAHLLWVRKKFAKVYIMYNPMINASAKPCQVSESLKFQLKLKAEVSLSERRSFCTHDSCYCWCSKKSQTTTWLGWRTKNVNHGETNYQPQLVSRICEPSPVLQPTSKLPKDVADGEESWIFPGSRNGRLWPVTFFDLAKNYGNCHVTQNVPSTSTWQFGI